MSRPFDYTDADLARGHKVVTLHNWVGGSLRKKIAEVIAVERAIMRAEMLGRVARTEAEIEKTAATIRRIWK